MHGWNYAVPIKSMLGCRNVSEYKYHKRHDTFTQDRRYLKLTSDSIFTTCVSLWGVPFVAHYTCLASLFHFRTCLH